ncbi:MAG: hypothetical protein N4A44_03015 [Alphaproteobacteria bacterium]|jgi:hypothetical protein|nr:hypothetical protein [Alphaproteobacteria bacterium]
MKLNKFALVLSVLTLTSCQQLQNTFTNTNNKANFTNGPTSEVPYSFSNFSDVPIPEESSMVVEKTRVFGEKDEWVGTLYLNSPFTLSNVFNFYSSQMEEFDWKKLSVIRGGETILTYIQEDRIATIFIEETSLSGTNISFTVSPIPNDIRKMFAPKEEANKETVIKEEIKTEGALEIETEEVEEKFHNPGALNIEETPAVEEAPSTNSSENNGLSNEEKDFFNF